MKLFCIFVIIFITFLEARSQDSRAHILRYIYNNDGISGYSFGVDTSNGIKLNEIGELRNLERQDAVIVVRGSYSYLGPDNVLYTVNYIADENGFQPEGEHIPPSAGVRKVGKPLPGAMLATLAGSGTSITG